MITATPDGRRLRIHVLQDADDTAAGSGITDVLVDPLPAKRGVLLSRLYVAQALATVPDLGVEVPTGEALESLFIEAIGAENYGRITGTIVVPQDPGSEQYAAGVRFRTFDEFEGQLAPDGEPLRHTEIQQILQAAFFWQSVVGIDGVNAYLEDMDLTRGKALGLLLTALGIQLSRTSRSSESGNQMPQAGTPSTSTPTGTSRSVVLHPVPSPSVASPRTPMDRQPPRNRRPLNFGRG